jgi:membrane associated rhomboid family serine protease
MGEQPSRKAVALAVCATLLVLLVVAACFWLHLTSQLAKADVLYESGQAKEAVELYRKHYWFAAQGERPKMIRRIVEYYSAVGDTFLSVSWIHRGENDGIHLEWTSPAAKKMYRRYEWSLRMRK